jgi:hypothetical protein
MGRARARPWAVTSAQTRPDITGRAGPALNYFGPCRAWAVLFSVLRAGPSGPAQMYTYNCCLLVIGRAESWVVRASMARAYRASG